MARLIHPDSDPADTEDDAASIVEALRRDGIDASHFLGLATLYSARGQYSAALECLQMAKEKCAFLPGPFKLHGRMLMRRKDYEGAARELARAIRFDPFDVEVAELLGRAEYERKNFAGALAATVDALLLLPDERSETASRLRRRIRTLKRVLKWRSRDLIALFHQRRELLTTAFDRLRWRRDLFLREKGLLEGQTLFGTSEFPSSTTRLALAARLRQISLWSSLSDEAIFHLTEAVHEEFYESRNSVFAFGAAGRDLYYLEQGEIALERPTPYGIFVLHRMRPGELLGEVNFVSDTGRTVEARALQPSRLLRIDADTLERLIEDSPDLGVQLYSSLWHSLAQKLRSSNDRLSGLFADSDAVAGGSAAALSRPAISSLGGDVVRVDLDDKIDLLQEQGLSHRELLTLATFSRELRLAAGTYLFREGDSGREMFIVLDGKIRISKFIPGGGEEALEIVERGGFFGEIALVDGQPRSADARAHDGPATVLALDQATVREVLSMDPHAALEFLRLLGRILAARVREIDEKMVMWRILAGPEAKSSRGA